MRSIRRRLLYTLLGIWIMVWVAVALVALDRSGHEIGELLDAQMAQTANVLRGLTLVGPLPIPAAAPQTMSPVGHPYEFKLSFQRWQGGQLVASFGAAPQEPLAPAMGFSNQEIGGARWRVFGLPGNLPDEVIFVAQNYTIRQELIQFLTTHALQPILWSLPLTVFLIWFAVGDGLRPLKRVARDIEQRSAERLEPIDGQSVPVEIQPLTQALNGLMERLSQTLATERRFAADASHELRTPFAIIRTHAQIAQRSSNQGEHDEALQNLIRGVDRATHLIAQLLTLARLSGERRGNQFDGERRSAALTGAVMQAVVDRQAAAGAKSIALTAVVMSEEPAVVAVPATVLDILVGNLIDNAVKFTPASGRVEVAVLWGSGCSLLRVTDSGPGLPASERERVFDRFYRRAGQAGSGSGLGLSIVRRICDRYGARIELRDRQDGVGLCVEVAFPEPARLKPHTPRGIRPWG
ncbi:MAG TPA: ATP-binding protein [Lamprocystis sp. (in: g-proteobacteria)]|nr:ATP-binding protein [Lamprocystis sp. (in: g-proteobacteria)]